MKKKVNILRRQRRKRVKIAMTKEEKAKERCPFLAKPGGCRMGARCSFKHDAGSVSATVNGQTFMVEEALVSALQKEREEIQERFSTAILEIQQKAGLK